MLLFPTSSSSLRDISLLPAVILLTCFTFVASELTISGPHTLIESRDLQITCNVSGPFKEDGYSWYKENQDITKNDMDPRITVSVSDSYQLKLTIQNAKLSDVGNYHCIHDRQNATTLVRTRPMLMQFEEFSTTNFRSANLIDGDNFTLNCSFFPGYGLDGQIEWWSFPEDEDYDPTTEDEEGFERKRKQIKINDERISIQNIGTTSSILTIKNINPNDRMFYVCKARNPVGVYNNTILLRVKPRYAAMFPLIGILAEVIILCIVIFVYEKRRIKPDFDDNVNSSTPKKTTDDGNRSTNDRSSRSLDVRQRK